MYETISQMMALHAVGHKSKEMINLMSDSCTSVWAVACVSQLLDAPVHSSYKYLPKHSVLSSFIFLLWYKDFSLVLF